jgi:hypothetical protein
MLNVLLARFGRCNTSQTIWAAVSATNAITDATKAAPGSVVRGSAAATAADVCRMPGLLPNEEMLIAATPAAAGHDQLLKS